MLQPCDLEQGAHHGDVTGVEECLGGVAHDASIDQVCIPQARNTLEVILRLAVIQAPVRDSIERDRQDFFLARHV